MTSKRYDKIIIGAGLFGLYAAIFSGKRGENILVLEYEDGPFKRATYCNQARVHLGYHYPRSIATAKKSAGYFNRFNDMYETSVHKTFNKIYATSKQFSWTNAEQFEKFCHDVEIPCTKLSNKTYFKEMMCDGAFETLEYTYDADILKDLLLEELKDLPNVEIMYGVRLGDIKNEDSKYKIHLNQVKTEDKILLETPYLLNATYASINQIVSKLGFTPFKIKYELCEIILCEPNETLKPYGITVMDGPFFSIMPFGKTPYHSLTSVTFTPHITSYDSLPTFECQERSGGYCTPKQLGNCNTCPAKPESAWPYMSSLAKKYLKDDFGFNYVESLYAIKPILMASEVDDSRPTVVKVFSEKPTFVSVLSGKINAVYDLEEVLTLE